MTDLKNNRGELEVQALQQNQNKRISHPLVPMPNWTKNKTASGKPKVKAIAWISLTGPGLEKRKNDPTIWPYSWSYLIHGEAGYFWPSAPKMSMVLILSTLHNESTTEQPKGFEHWNPRLITQHTKHLTLQFNAWKKW